MTLNDVRLECQAIVDAMDATEELVNYYSLMYREHPGPSMYKAEPRFARNLYRQDPEYIRLVVIARLLNNKYFGSSYEEYSAWMFDKTPIVGVEDDIHN